MTLRELITKSTEEQGLTHGALAKLSGVPRPNISRYFAGDRDMTGATIDRLATALGLSWRAVYRVSRRRK